MRRRQRAEQQPKREDKAPRHAVRVGGWPFARRNNGRGTRQRVANQDGAPYLSHRGDGPLHVDQVYVHNGGLHPNEVEAICT